MFFSLTSDGTLGFYCAREVSGSIVVIIIKVAHIFIHVRFYLFFLPFSYITRLCPAVDHSMVVVLFFLALFVSQIMLRIV